MNKLFTILFSVFLIAGCSLSGDDSQLEEITKFEEEWKAADLENYSYRAEVYCFCGHTGPAIVVVKNGEKTNFLDVETQEEIMITWNEEQYALIELVPETYPTISELFEIAKDAERKNANRLDIDYQKNPYSYPAKVSIDYRKDTVDDEVTYRASSIKIIAITED